MYIRCLRNSTFVITGQFFRLVPGIVNRALYQKTVRIRERDGQKKKRAFDVSRGRTLSAVVHCRRRGLKSDVSYLPSCFSRPTHERFSHGAIFMYYLLGRSGMENGPGTRTLFGATVRVGGSALIRTTRQVRL